MKKTMAFTALILCYSLLTFAQDCKFYYPKTQNAQLEFKSFDKKDKLTGSSIQTIKSISETGNSTSAILQVQSFDRKGKDLGKKEYGIQCENGVYSVDMKSFMDARTMEAYKDMEVSVESNNLKIPANMNIGDDLADGKLEISIYSEGMKMMSMTTDITQRKVEAKEEVTTEAGTFNCYKITYTITIKTMFSMRMEAADWIAESVGSVKSETYSNGKIMAYTLLTSIKKQ